MEKTKKDLLRTERKKIKFRNLLILTIAGTISLKLRERTTMKKSVRLTGCILLFLFLLALCLIYTRPLTVEQRYPYLDFSQLTEIKGYCYTVPGEESEQFVLTPSDAEFSRLLRSIQSTDFKTKLSNLLPQRTKVHTNAVDDFKWELRFCFRTLALPDGSAVSGEVLGIENFFGDLSISAEGTTVLCCVDEQEPWADEIMAIISQYIIEN